MITMHKKQSGFTVIELLIVILVIGILAALVISTYSGVQVKERNSTRQTDIQVIQTQLEAYYSQNGYYPSLNNINNAAWRTKNMTNLKSSNLVDPSAKNKDTNVAILVSTPTKGAYAYDVTDSDGDSCETNQTTCAKYTLTATFEGSVNGQKTYVKQNLD